MFEVGKHYKITMWSDEDGGVLTEYGASKVIKVEGSLIKVRDVVEGAEIILNTSSIAFVSAIEDNG